MEYIAHGDMSAYLERFAPLPEQQTRRIAYQVCEGLDFMHDNGFAHRDLKPAVRNLTPLA
jgi:serine/threonine protein kinase